MSDRLHIAPFFDAPTGTVSYVVSDTVARRAAIIDPVLDYDARSGRTATVSADRLLAHVAAQSLAVDWILETHAHADHLSAAPYIKARVGGRLAIGRHILGVQATFKQLFNLGPSFLPDGRQFDHLLDDGEHLQVGGLDVVAMAVPGHTPADMAYAIGDAVFVGDTLFMPDVGTARADFPGGDAAMLHRSIQRLLALPPATRLFVCHDYPPDGRAPVWQTTVAAQRAGNIHVRDGVSQAAFVAMREARDAGLGLPALMIPAIQVNVRGGQLPPAEDDGVRYLKIPIDVLGGGAAARTPAR